MSPADVSGSVRPSFRTSWEGDKECDKKQMVKQEGTKCSAGRGEWN